jgi:hypothetical protein
MSHIPFDDRRTKSRRSEHIVFRLLVLLTFPLFLAAALLARLTPFRSTRAPRSSVFTEARGASEAAIAFAFQG